MKTPFERANDSIYNLFKSSSDPELKLSQLSKLVDRTFYTMQRKKTLSYFGEAKELENEQLSSKAKHILKYIISWEHEHHNEFSEKTELLTECVNFFDLEQDTSFYVRSRYHLGELFFRTGRYETGLKYLSELRRYFKNNPHPLESINIRKLVRTYANLNQNETALELISEFSNEYENRPGFKWDIAHMRHYMVKGMILSNLGQIDQAIIVTEKVLEEAEKVGNKILINNSRSELAKYYLSKGEIEKAKKLAHDAYDHYEILKVNYPSMTSTRVTLGRIYYAAGNYQTAIKYYNEAVVLAKYHHRLLNHKEAIAGLIQCNIQLKKDKSLILDQLKEYDLLKDSLLNKDMSATVQDLRIKYETEKKEDALIQLNKENELANQSLKSARRNNIYLISAFFFLLLFLALLARLFYNNLKAKRLLESKNQIIAKSLNEKQLLLKEIHHRVKNNLQTVSSLLSLQSNYIKDKKVLKALKDGQDRVQSMALIHQNLYQDDNLRNVNVRSYFKKLLNGLYQSYFIDPELIKLNLEVDDILMDVEKIIPIGLITNELVTNVFKYAFEPKEKGELTVTLKGDTPLILKVKDTGKGMAESAVGNKSDSFGYQMIKAFCNKLDAELIIDSKNGTEITITIENNKVHEKNTDR